MDPEVSLLVQCPLGGLAEEQVRAELSPAYDRRPLPGGEDSIVAAWDARRQAQPWIFNAPKFRLHSAVLGPPDPGGPCLMLRMGLTSYQDFLGTNWAGSAGRLRCQGKADWGDAQAYLADPLGVGAMLGTLDGFLVFLRRSLRVAEAPGLIDVPGGHPEPQALFPGETPRHEDLPEDLVVPELFSSILQEIRDEVNVPLSTLSRPLLLGIARNETSAGRASAEFYVSCNLTSEQVRTLYMTGGPEAHESTGIIFMETQRVRRLQEESEAWGELCPSAKGAILLYNLVQARPA
ncbi:uridine diphosphate glucose pyrophosphatase NUDT22 [Trichosurus vulpecula]|uniref:uridine diphosphate glucose pyrophosphatase NUDT22 n=1 Tax=Trichosurus vulpecula TaxID=9337 RepID=UPI00186B47A2|nr:uridine diphosphate glucose pyrophosphatase NUDT22 [Trichosurus vulpecula]XP_036618159.1 uridine diphosphate glucose pyrophosphatase NUDT22 [Trichosurus vulpecula]